MNYFKLLIISLFFVACNQQKQDSSKVEKNVFEFGVWTTANPSKTNEDYIAEFKKYKDGGIDEVLINTNTDPELLKRLVPLATQQGLKVHAWIMTMNRPGDTIALKHPDWYMVSRNGKSCFDDRPYVDYYQWLSPSHPEAREHIYGLLEELAKVEGIESVHLDYIRYPDVFLPVGLLPKYNLEQNTELPDYDFDYSDASVNAFIKEFGKDPRKMEHPEIDMEWKNFRLNQIKNVVDHAYEIAHKHGKTLTAAVFPYPEMADHMVRQRWDKWNIDEVYPMIYHNFYNEGANWVGFATKQGVEDLKGRKTKLNTGIYIPGVNSQEELKETILLAKKMGAKGVSFFDGNALTEEDLKTIKEIKASL
ncbi:family 10 glycosylhydrolase [Wenyingzhuangia sp. chi5]|uniref:Family 10 glycosylhydrolase n=1 Tax=Wenyingzhuangia gilva TaxID=3057677 RepID=A0ABT8VRS3_9FLAO|nr:family 10 glycosylhydrolase [Wenyingzhuangia sp. chi5]MDO3694670.1 family 10 glycosylhydrolase [Wenyingzhuangia sp. chi5]